MQRLVQTILSLVPQRDADGHLHINRFARGSSYDRALAAFKADQKKRAAKNTRMIPGEWQERQMKRSKA
jgi:hypothetical protein